MMASIVLGIGAAVFGGVLFLVSLIWIKDIRENRRLKRDLEQMFREHADSIRK